MKNWKKAGLTALAGSLVATSAFAGAMTVSGTANITYTAKTGKQDNGRYRLQQLTEKQETMVLDGVLIKLYHSVVQESWTTVGLFLFHNH